MPSISCQSRKSYYRSWSLYKNHLPQQSQFHMHSQPVKGRTYWGNLLLGAAILYSGNLPHKFLNVFRSLKVVIFTDRTYFNYQRRILPVIKDVWKLEKQALFKEF